MNDLHDLMVDEQTVSKREQKEILLHVQDRVEDQTSPSYIKDTT